MLKFNILLSQKDGFGNLLELNSASDDIFGSKHKSDSKMVSFKALVYDKPCCDRLSPIMKVSCCFLLYNV